MSEDDNITDNINTPPQNSYRSISLDKVIDINTVFSQTPTGRNIKELLLEGKKPDGKMLSQITHVLCDCLLAVYGERPSTDHKEMIAKSLVKTYPILGSTVSEQPYIREVIFI
ncbi:uncharacterized protein LOC129716604 [Wyeomyia smithii]|uniref:uncharacterized protein LOC129716604 n=1 Tax=Wyeomyia smithii TaxID=174621 RepID=UPI0024680140|nr:uncharacterized protein LOC129716604 [Wyeomyia smithii]